MANNKKVGVHGTDAETGRLKGLGEKKCKVDRVEFATHAHPLKCKLLVPQASDTEMSEVNVVLAPKEYSTGTLGYFTTMKVDVMINGKLCPCTAQFQIYLSHSKPGE